jgi:hypothetical protein
VFLSTPMSAVVFRGVSKVIYRRMGVTTRSEDRTAKDLGLDLYCIQLTQGDILQGLNQAKSILNQYADTSVRTDYIFRLLLTWMLWSDLRDPCELRNCRGRTKFTGYGKELRVLTSQMMWYMSFKLLSLVVIHKTRHINGVSFFASAIIMYNLWPTVHWKHWVVEIPHRAAKLSAE